jgi:hypothetical protein
VAAAYTTDESRPGCEPVNTSRLSCSSDATTATTACAVPPPHRVSAGGPPALTPWPQYSGSYSDACGVNQPHGDSGGMS